jgi:HK97 family phage major capsid protein
MNTNTMERDFAALRRGLEAGVALERREAPDATKLTETIDRIGSAFEEYKKANDQALAEVRKQGGVSPETEAKLAAINKELDQLGSIKSRLEKLETREARPVGRPLPGERREVSPAEREHRDAFINWVRNPRSYEAETEVRSKEKALPPEKKSIDTLTGAAGGFAVPEVIASEIMRIGVDLTPMRSICRVITAGTPEYKELVDTGGATFGWAGETDARNETNTPGLVEVTPTFGTAYAYPRATEESLQDIFFDVEKWMIDSAVEAIAKGENIAFHTGNGTKKPTGFLAGTAPTAQDDAVRPFGTLEYKPSGAASTLPTSPDVFLDLVYSLRARYRSNARWLTSKLVLAALRKYKDGENNYLWQPGLVANQPSTFLGYPLVEDEDMPAVAANAFPIAFGDFRSGYLIVDLAGMRMTRDEITTPGYVKFHIRKRVGGIRKDSQAIKLLKIATS